MLIESCDVWKILTYLFFLGLDKYGERKLYFSDLFILLPISFDCEFLFFLNSFYNMKYWEFI